MNKTRVFYPILWTFFISGVIIGTLCANFLPQEWIRTLGIYQIYDKSYLNTFSAFDRNWILYIFLNRIKFWILYVLLSFTAAKWVVTLIGIASFGCISSILLVATTRLCGAFSILLFGATLLPHYVLYVIAFLFMTEATRITTIASQKIVLEKAVKASLFWCIGIVCEIFMNPTLVYWTAQFLKL